MLLSPAWLWPYRYMPTTPVVRGEGMRRHRPTRPASPTFMGPEHPGHRPLNRVSTSSPVSHRDKEPTQTPLDKQDPLRNEGMAGGVRTADLGGAPCEA